MVSYPTCTDIAMLPGTPCQYKYAQHLADIQSCPPVGTSNEDATLFRFVFSELAHGNNFLPPQIIKPGREFQDPVERCSAFALSLFRTTDEATAAYRKLKANNKKIGKRIGTHLARISLRRADGALTPEDEEGHCDLHEHQDCDLLPRATMLGPIEQGSNNE